MSISMTKRMKIDLWHPMCSPSLASAVVVLLQRRILRLLQPLRPLRDLALLPRRLASRAKPAKIEALIHKYPQGLHIFHLLQVFFWFNLSHEKQHHTAQKKHFLGCPRCPRPPLAPPAGPPKLAHYSARSLRSCGSEHAWNLEDRRTGGQI